MARNLDTTALRSFVTVADTGGVTKAPGMLHLTQSAVSMQLKRLEESLGVLLLDRSARQTAPIPAEANLPSGHVFDCFVYAIQDRPSAGGPL